MSRDAWLAALLDQYHTTLRRLQESFVGPERLEPPAPLSEDDFRAAYREAGDAADAWVRDFRDLESRARACAGLPETGDGDVPDDAYERYRAWLPFAHMRRVLVPRIAETLGYGER